jgi:hypothetical protein
MEATLNWLLSYPNFPKGVASTYKPQLLNVTCTCGVVYVSRYNIFEKVYIYPLENVVWLSMFCIKKYKNDKNVLKKNIKEILASK